MALTEDQIQRYGRQILLRELGGRGQQRLLAATVQVDGEGPAFDDALAYLAAGGSPLAHEAPVGGFLGGAPLTALNPDARAAAQASPAVWLSARREGHGGRAAVVLAGGVAWRRADACEACWTECLQALGEGEGPPGLGALAALSVQRLVLGWSEPAGVVRWTGARFEASSPRCAEHLRQA